MLKQKINVLPVLEQRKSFEIDYLFCSIPVQFPGDLYKHSHNNIKHSKLTLKFTPMETGGAQQVVLERIEASPPVGRAAGCHAAAATGAGGRGQRERAHPSPSLRPRGRRGRGGGGRGGGRVVRVVDRGAQGCGQRRALGSDLWHRVGRVWVEALSH